MPTRRPSWRTKMSITYVASPYNHPDSTVREYRYLAVVNFTAWLSLNRPITPYSPIVHWHEIAKRYKLPTHADYWLKINHDMIDQCDSIHVLCINGWKTSVGVTEEINYARDHGKELMFAMPDYTEGVDAPFYDLSPIKPY